MNRSFVSSLIGGEFCALDIGARGDIPRHWLPLDGVANIISFDADSRSCDALRKTYDSRGHGAMYQVHDVALGKADERRTLYLTRGRGGSSLYRPDTPFIKEYANAHYCEVEEEIELATRHAGDYFAECCIDDVDLLKIDIQGAELEVLQALSSDLCDKILMIETEVQFHDRKNGAPAFCDIHHFLSQRGFALLDINAVKHHPALEGKRSKSVLPFGVPLDSPSISRRVWYGDALYYRTGSADLRKLRNLLAGLCLYGFFTEAYKALHSARQDGVIDHGQEREFVNTIVDWHNNETYRWRYGNNSLARIWQRMIGRFRLAENPLFQWTED